MGLVEIITTVIGLYLMIGAVYAMADPETLRAPIPAGVINFAHVMVFWPWLSRL